jgi:hypothetical protein
MAHGPGLTNLVWQAQACQIVRSDLSKNETVAIGFTAMKDGHAGPVADLLHSTLAGRTGFTVEQVIGNCRPPPGPP